MIAVARKDDPFEARSQHRQISDDISARDCTWERNTFDRTSPEFQGQNSSSWKAVEKYNSWKMTASFVNPVVGLGRYK